MSINAELLPFLDQFPQLELTKENLRQTRSELNRMSLEAAAVIEGYDHVGVADEKIAGPSPNQTLRLRLYSGPDAPGLRPCLLWIHGGGYILGCPEMDELLLCRMVDELGCLIVSVDYRLAPEHPYPAALDDCDTALGWILENAEALSIDTQSLALGGASAGGGLAAALALRCRDRRPGAITYQCLIYPMLRSPQRASRARSWHQLLAVGPGPQPIRMGSLFESQRLLSKRLPVRIAGESAKSRWPAANLPVHRRSGPVLRRISRVRKPPARERRAG